MSHLLQIPWAVTPNLNSPGSLWKSNPFSTQTGNQHGVEIHKPFPAPKTELESGLFLST